MKRSESKPNPFKEFVNQSPEITQGLGHKEYSSQKAEAFDKLVQRATLFRKEIQERISPKYNKIDEYIESDEFTAVLEDETETTELSSLEQVEMRASFTAITAINAVRSKLFEMDANGVIDSKPFDPKILKEQLLRYYETEYDEEVLWGKSLYERVLRRALDPDYLESFYAEHGIEKDELDFRFPDIKIITKSPDFWGFYKLELVVEDIRRARLEGPPEADDETSDDFNPVDIPEEDLQVLLKISEDMGRAHQDGEPRSLNQYKQMVYESVSRDPTGISFIEEVVLPELKNKYERALAEGQDMQSYADVLQFAYPAFLFAYEQYKEGLVHYLDPNMFSPTAS